jgi:hypothetical protein
METQGWIVTADIRIKKAAYDVHNSRNLIINLMQLLLQYNMQYAGEYNYLHMLR